MTGIARKDDTARLLGEFDRRIAGVERRVLTGVGAPDLAWHIVGDPGEPAFAPGWGVKLGINPARFIRVQGFIHLAGEPYADAGAGNLIFTLPEEYAPNERVGLAVMRMSGGPGEAAVPLEVNTNGDVLLRVTPVFDERYNITAAPFSQFGRNP